MSNYPLRLPENVMEDAKHLAAANGSSLNQFLVAVVAERIGEMKATAEIERRIARADHKKALAVLDRVPSRPPVPGDELEPTT